jgi:hypothetical protein
MQIGDQAVQPCVERLKDEVRDRTTVVLAWLTLETVGEDGAAARGGVARMRRRAPSPARQLCGAWRSLSGGVVSLDVPVLLYAASTLAQVQ